MKKAVVCGGSGFIGHHLVNRLKDEGYWVRVVDIKECKYETREDQFYNLDLRIPKNCERAVRGMDEVYQLAADMGGMGFIASHEVDCLTNNALININMIKAACEESVHKYFFSSSVCIYTDSQIFLPGAITPEWNEEDAYPANPDNEYGWEKLYSERVVSAYGRNYPTNIYIARFQNIYGTECTWDGGREKAPAVMCRKIAKAKDRYEVWGDGTQVRLYTHIDDLVEGIIVLTNSDRHKPTIIGADRSVTLNELCDIIEKESGKKLKRKYVKGEVGVQVRAFDKSVIKSLGWSAKRKLERGMRTLYNWIDKQIK